MEFEHKRVEDQIATAQHQLEEARRTLGRLYMQHAEPRIDGCLAALDTLMRVLDSLYVDSRAISEQARPGTMF